MDRTDLRQDVRTSEPGEHDLFSHYAEKGEIMKSMIEGKEITALCGKKWIVTRDPDNYPLCGTCKDIYDQLKS